MNRTELVEAVANKTGLTKTDADAAVKAFSEVVLESVKKREKVSLPGFLTFDVSHRNARTARNPRTGEEIKVAATWAPKVSAGSALKAAAAASK